MEDLTTGSEDFFSSINMDQMTYLNKTIAVAQLTGYPYVSLSRSVLLEDVLIQKLDLIPGFNFNWAWYCKGIEIEPYAPYSSDTQSSAPMFARNNKFSVKHQGKDIHHPPSTIYKLPLSDLPRSTLCPSLSLSFTI